MNILVLVSGNGTNLQALIDAEQAGRFNDADYGSGHIAAVVSDRPGVFALERAKEAGIPAFVEAPDKAYPAGTALPKEERRRELSDRICGIARREEAGLIILAGFLSILQGKILTEYQGRIINLHPSLLPQYGGPGMYGGRVHQAVLAAGETESGCTVHFVDAGTDTGPILLQRKVPVLKDDTAATLAERVHREEHIAIVEAAVLMLSKLNAKKQEK